MSTRLHSRSMFPSNSRQRSSPSYGQVVAAECDAAANRAHVVSSRRRQAAVWWSRSAQPGPTVCLNGSTAVGSVEPLPALRVKAGSGSISSLFRNRQEVGPPVAVVSRCGQLASRVFVFTVTREGGQWTVFRQKFCCLFRWDSS